jgi:hypothetical protein
VDSVPEPLLLRKPGSAGNRTRAFESVVRNSTHSTTEAVYTLTGNEYSVIALIFELQ